VTPEGPAEVAAVSESLNALAAALTTSEDRQRASSDPSQLPDLNALTIAHT